MQLRTVREADVAGKNVLVRVDFNESVDAHGDVKSSYKITAARETIDWLVDNGAAHVALLTHFGRPSDAHDLRYSVEQLQDDVARVLAREITFVPACIGAPVADALRDAPTGAVLLLENVRYHAEEENNDAAFAAALCAPFEVYVNEAFAVCHRKHASVHAVTQCTASYAGLWLAKEVEYLTRVKSAPDHPAVAVIGGAKIETKLPLITSFAKNYDTVLVGGRTAVEAQEQKMVFPDNVVLPEDFAYKFYDIGPRAVAHFAEVIAQAKMIVWNGPMGKMEEAQYRVATCTLLRAIADNRDAFSLIGGGETVQVAEECGVLEQMSFASTGGGAMLAFLGDEEMPGLAVLMRT